MIEEPLRAVLQSTYYADKVESLQQSVGARDVRVDADAIHLDGRTYPVADDVIVCLRPAHWPSSLHGRPPGADAVSSRERFASALQYTFGEEWKTFSGILLEPQAEFKSY